MAITEMTGTIKQVAENGDELHLFPNVKTDTTLSVEGKAADAKVVGDRLTTNTMSTVVLESQDAIDNYLNVDLPDSLGADTRYTRQLVFNTGHNVLGSGSYLLDGHKISDDYQWQRVTSYSDGGSGEIRVFEREKYAGVWNDWTKRSANATKVNIIDGDVTTPLSSLNIQKFDSQEEYEAANLEEDRMYAFPDMIVRPVYEHAYCTITTTPSYTGLSIVIPAKTFFSLTATLPSNYSQADVVAICDGSDWVVPERASGKAGFFNACCTYTDYTENELTLHIWARFEDPMEGATNPVYVRGFFITKG